MVAMQRPLGAIPAFYRPTAQNPSITNCLVAIVHTKPVIAILVPKLVAMATTLRHSISAMWGSGRPSSTWFLGPTRVLNPNGISIGSAVFAGLASVTDKQTDPQTDRQTDRIYVVQQCDLIIATKLNRNVKHDMLILLAHDAFQRYSTV